MAMSAVQLSRIITSPGYPGAGSRTRGKVRPIDCEQWGQSPTASGISALHLHPNTEEGARGIEKSQSKHSYHPPSFQCSESPREKVPVKPPLSFHMENRAPEF